MTPWSQLAPKVHLRRKVKYQKCHFLSALHFPEIQGSRFEIFRLHRFSFTSDSLSPNSLQGVAMLTSIYTKGFHGLQATSCRLQARGGRLQATGNRLQARSNSKPGATSSRQQATAISIMLWGGPQDHFGMLAGFQKAVISICICCLGVAR